MTDFLIQFGYWGMGIASFIAGTIFPFSSEAILVALLATVSINPTLLVISATIGNVSGTMFNYFVGRQCSPKTVARWFKIKQSRMDKAQSYVQKYGAWMGFFTFVPILGTALSLTLGVLRANALFTFISTFIGKSLRYIVIAYATIAIAG